MKIVFITQKPSSPSFQFYRKAFSKLIKLDDIKKIDFVTTKYKDNIFLKYDIVIFMGGSIRKDYAKMINAKIKIVVIDSRAGHYDDLSNIDLLICNSLEMQILHQHLETDFFVYPTYPLVPNSTFEKASKDKILLGYHGNKVHLETMYPRISKAIYNLSFDYKIEFLAMYNIEKFKKSKIISENNFGCKIIHLNYSYENYKKISEVDIGLVPQLIPYLDNFFSRSFLKKYNESSNDYILRFKDTNNIGRHLVFAQYKIPVITDMTPSSCQLIEHGENSYFAYSEKSWKNLIEILIKNKQKRIQMGKNFYLKWKENYSHDLLNNMLLKKLKKICKN